MPPVTPAFHRWFSAPPARNGAARRTLFGLMLVVAATLLGAPAHAAVPMCSNDGRSIAAPPIILPWHERTLEAPKPCAPSDNSLVTSAPDRSPTSPSATGQPRAAPRDARRVVQRPFADEHARPARVARSSVEPSSSCTASTDHHARDAHASRGNRRDANGSACRLNANAASPRRPPQDLGPESATLGAFGDPPAALSRKGLRSTAFRNANRLGNSGDMS